MANSDQNPQDYSRNKYPDGGLGGSVTGEQYTGKIAPDGGQGKGKAEQYTGKKAPRTELG